MSLKDNLVSDLKQAMLSRDELKTSTIRMLSSSIKNYEINKGGAGYSASDDEVLGLIQKEIKQRQDSIESFVSGGREDLANKERDEMEILRTYLPPQISEEELRQIVKKAIVDSGASGLSDMGKVMALIMPQVKGKADGGFVSAITKEQLS